MHLFSNNAETTLQSAITSDAVSITAVADGSAGRFASIPAGSSGRGRVQLATLTHSSYPGAYEVVKITARVGTAFTVVRGLEGTAQAWPAGTLMSARVTAEMLGAFLQRDDNSVVRNGNGSGLFVFDKSSDVDYTSHAAASTGNDRSFVYHGRSRLFDAVQLSGYPVLQREMARIGDPSTDHDLNLSYPSVGGSIPVDLGVVPAWDAVGYSRGAVVVPTTPNGHQYWLEIASIDDETSSETTEPAWTTSEAPAVAGTWRATPMPIDIDRDFVHDIVVTEVGFIAHVATATTPPSVSIGTAADRTRWANSVALSQISGNGQIHRIPITAGGALARDIRFSVDTAATGGRFLGRFYWRGFFVEIDTGL